MAKIEKKSKIKPKKKATKSATLKSQTAVRKTKSTSRTVSKTVAAVKRVKKNVRSTKVSAPVKRTLVQSSSKSLPPAHQPVILQNREKNAVKKSPLDQKQVSTEELRRMLLERRNGILKNLDEEIVPARENEVSVVAGDVVDLAQESSKNELSLHLAEVESRELGQIDKAIQKLGEGTYGICEKCGGIISPARLKALPFANKCIRCQEEDERENF